MPYRVAAPGDENLPLPHERGSFSVRYDLQYAFVVDGKTYYALQFTIATSKTADTSIHYDPA